ncbi:MAG: hypothetical protein ACYCXG_08005 [Acidiferrobacter sp.]
MNDDPLASLYRKPCPSCARDLARDAHRCAYCGYAEPGAGDAEEDQERLYGEYLSARLRQARDAVERLQREQVMHPDDHAHERRWHQAGTELRAAEREWHAYEEARLPATTPAISVPPVAAPVTPPAPVAARDLRTAVTRAVDGQIGDRQVAIGDKVCPACTATLPSEVGHCACGHVFGGGVTTTTCPHCTAIVDRSQTRCACGYPLSVGPMLPSAALTGRSKRY